ncbi:hypothetical protein [Nocardia nova]|uniref:hypothetical protein n=1 Tax=Nocardia nova TaxID=37330 RepID=UPI00189596F1|nr:hypothetical protein [Nocardia nova]MBF6277015.1 hypothetical protein [Nocardia nova]
MSEPTPAQILATPMHGENNDAEADTIRGYLIALLATLWREEEGFSGKRPFGNSGWRFDLYAALGHAGHIRASFDDDGYLEDVDAIVGDRLIATAIEALGVGG